MALLVVEQFGKGYFVIWDKLLAVVRRDSSHGAGVLQHPRSPTIDQLPDYRALVAVCRVNLRNYCILVNLSLYKFFEVFYSQTKLHTKYFEVYIKYSLFLPQVNGERE
jgi:hypothetical protein